MRIMAAMRILGNAFQAAGNRLVTHRENACYQAIGMKNSPQGTHRITREA